MAPRKKKSNAQILRDDKAFKGWWKLTGKTKTGKSFYARAPTSANIKIKAKIRIDKGAKNIKITEL